MADMVSSVWNSVIVGLREELTPTGFNTWFEEARPIALSDQSLTIAVPDAVTKGGIERRFRKTIEELASKTCNHPVALIIEVSNDGEEGSSPQARPSTRDTQSTLPLNADYTFEAFVRGKNCDLAYFAAEAVADKLGTAYNPLFIYGNVGLGKTHLLQAIGNHVLRAYPGRSVMYTTSERFAIELINAIRSNTTPAFRNKYRQIDLLLIDDVHFLEGKEATQEELFHTFNELHGSEKQIVLSSDRAPEELSGLQERLVSRFRWGLVADIQAPDLETRIAILREKALSRGLDIDVSLLELIATRISSNVRALEGALIKAIAYAELRGESLTPSTLEGVLPKEGQRPRLTITHIKEEVAAQCNLKRQDLESSSRKKEISHARHLAIYLARELTNHSFPAIAREFGNRDHTTIMHSYVKVKTMIKETPLLFVELSEIQEILLARYAVSR
ncbi:chromosomal replication initiator protein DnaA [Candidatus Bipolaricaulota bacterium]|nr:chromosomal replication initiator protein DnaA [Candidatus Bipolaricaulota bacterium]